MATKHNDQFLIADTSGLISLFVKTDSNHEAALARADQLEEDEGTVIVPHDVVVETVNTLGKKSGHAVAVKAANELLAAGTFLIVGTAEYLEDALARFREQPEAVSLTDCLVMTVADVYGTKEIFGFDRQFAQAGYHVIQPVTQAA